MEAEGYRLPVTRAGCQRGRNDFVAGVDQHLVMSTIAAVRPLERLGRIILAGGIAGAAAGLLWGGIGGRIAMRVVFLTSDPAVGGLQSDDDFTIGVISSSTVFLLMFTTIIGAILGSGAAVLRSALRTGTRTAAIGFGLAAGAFIGGLIVHADGIDFRLLDPLFLTVGLFILIPAGAAVTGVVLIDRFLRPGSLQSRLPGHLVEAVALLGAIPLVILTGAAVRNPAALLMLAGIVATGLVVAAITTRTAEVSARSRTAVHWAAWGLLAALTVIGTVELVGDVAALT